MTNNPTSRREKLRKLAEAATQASPWSVRNIRRTDKWPHDDSFSVVDANGVWVAEVGPAPEDAAFVAAANPQAVIELLDDNERLSTELEALKAECERLRVSEDWHRLHSKMFAKAADNEKADREAFRQALQETRSQLADAEREIERLRKEEEHWSRECHREVRERMALKEQLAATRRALTAALATWCPRDPGGDGADGDTYRLCTAALAAGDKP